MFDYRWLGIVLVLVAVSQGCRLGANARCERAIALLRAEKIDLEDRYYALEAELDRLRRQQPDSPQPMYDRDRPSGRDSDWQPFPDWESIEGLPDDSSSRPRTDRNRRTVPAQSASSELPEVEIKIGDFAVPDGPTAPGRQREGGGDTNWRDPFQPGAPQRPDSPTDSHPSDRDIQRPVGPTQHFPSPNSPVSLNSLTPPPQAGYPQADHRQHDRQQDHQQADHQQADHQQVDYQQEVPLLSEPELAELIDDLKLEWQIVEQVVERQEPYPNQLRNSEIKWTQRWLVVQPVDQMGDALPLPGEITLSLIDPERERANQRLGLWTFSVEQVDGWVRDGESEVPGIHVPIPDAPQLQQELQQSESWVAYVRYVGLDGRRWERAIPAAAATAAGDVERRTDAVRAVPTTGEELAGPDRDHDDWDWKPYR